METLSWQSGRFSPEKEMLTPTGCEDEWASGIAHLLFTQGRPHTVELAGFVSSGLVDWLVD